MSIDELKVAIAKQTQALEAITSVDDNLFENKFREVVALCQTLTASMPEPRDDKYPYIERVLNMVTNELLPYALAGNTDALDDTKVWVREQVNRLLDLFPHPPFYY